MLVAFLCAGISTDGKAHVEFVAEMLQTSPNAASDSLQYLAFQGLAAACSATQQQEQCNHLRTAVKHLLPVLNLTWAGV